MVQRLRALAMALPVFAGVTAVAQARRAGSLLPVETDEPSCRDDGIDGSMGLPIMLAEAQRGRPFRGLWPLHVKNINTREAIDVRLYDDAGRIDDASASELDRLLCDSRQSGEIFTTTLDRRTLQLLFRAAYHFRSHEVTIISGYRKPGARSEGRHGLGRAVDFRLARVSPGAIAAYLRTLSRVGVGIYTHPDTQFVHLDDRDQSYHWIDASPPGRTWRERAIWGRGMGKRDAAYSPEGDWPEGTERPLVPSQEAMSLVDD